MDHGTLTDNNGRKAEHHPDHDHQRRRGSGGARVDRLQQDHTTDAMEVIKKSFTPEFRNRLDTIIQFGRLSTETIKSVVDKFLTELQAQLEDKRVQARGQRCGARLAGGEGHDVQMGARPMARLIQDKIKRPLAERSCSASGRAWRPGACRPEGRRAAFEFEITAAEPA